MMKMLAYDASERITAREALRHPYFREIRDMEMRRQQAMAAHPSLSTSMQNQEGGDKAALPRADDMAASNKALPTIGGAGNTSTSSIGSGMKGKNSAKIIPQGMQGASHVHGASKYASGAAGGAPVDAGESEME